MTEKNNNTPFEDTLTYRATIGRLDGEDQEVSPPSPEPKISVNTTTRNPCGVQDHADAAHIVGGRNVARVLKLARKYRDMVYDLTWRLEEEEAMHCHTANMYDKKLAALGDTRELKAALPLCVCHDVFYENCPTFKKGICITISGATSSQLG